jgi:hypothetical protein
VFLDIPSPWSVISKVPIVFKPESIGRICTFSPCIEQVHKTVMELETTHFKDIRTFECLIRPAEIKYIQLPLLSDRPNMNESEMISSFSEEEEGLEEAKKSSSNPFKKRKLIQSSTIPSIKEYITTKTLHHIRGHTSYLTFATYLHED